MKFYIKKWRYDKVALMADQGQVLAYFSSVKEALKACDEWYFANNRNRTGKIPLVHKPENVKYKIA